jgi:cephalosporin hydroxylase
MNNTTEETRKISEWVAANMQGKDDPNFKRIHHHDHHIVLYIKDHIMKEMCDTYFEVGTHFGHSLCTALQSKYKSKFVSCDLFKTGPIASDCKIKDVEELARKNVDWFNKSGYECRVIKRNSRDKHTRDLVKGLCPDGIDLLFIDGDHRHVAVLGDFELYFPLVNPGGYIVFDDYLPFQLGGKKRGCPIAVDKIAKDYGEKLESAGLAKDIDVDKSNKAFVMKKI